MASFPPRLPHYFISRFTNPGDIVLDPFCGRGTTIAEACLMGRMGIGNDLNPIAVVLTRAKVQTPDKRAILKRVENLKANYYKLNLSEIPENISMLYSKKVLHQLLYLKRELNIERKVDNFIMALILGGMHGNSLKPSYLSIPMPNTFSMSPNYVKNYIKKHHLVPPPHDVFQVIRHRLERCLDDKFQVNEGKIFNQDIRSISKKFLNDKKANLIFTSPPYLRVIKYGKLNWIRLWMLGYTPIEIDNKLDDQHTIPRYMEFMKETLNELVKVMEDDALCFVVVGQVNGNRGPGKGKQMRLGNQIRRRLNNKINLEFLDLIDDKYNRYLRVQKNVSRIWGKYEGKATRYDQILVLAKDIDLIEKKKYNDVKW
jgi:site-specific DNA-methyltransferase (adenine-specific)